MTVIVHTVTTYDKSKWLTGSNTISYSCILQISEISEVSDTLYNGKNNLYINVYIIKCSLMYF